MARYIVKSAGIRSWRAYVEACGIGWFWTDSEADAHRFATKAEAQAHADRQNVYTDIVEVADEPQVA